MTKTTTVTLAIAALALASPAFAADEVIVYDNSSGFQSLMTREGNTEIGDQIRLTGSGFTISSFEFEYNYIRNGGDGEVTAQIRFYNITDAPIGGGEFADYPAAEAFAVSPVFTLSEGLGRRVWAGAGGTQGDRPPLGFEIPQDFLWTVRFGGLEGGEEAGLLFYGTPEVGSSTDEFWARDTAFDDWQLFDTPGFFDGFGARVIAVPEPSTLALLGGAALLMGLRRRKA